MEFNIRLEEEVSNSKYDRRKPLLESMKSDDEKGFNCHSCKAPCCTYTSNSMMVSKVEALDLFEFAKNLENLKDRCLETIKRFRLDKEFPGLNKTLRRTYTCPFFKGESLGCEIAFENKPYGCLGFNPNKENQIEGGDCTSRTNILETSDSLSEDLNSKIDFNWQKKTIPEAMIFLLEKFADTKKQ